MAFDNIFNKAKTVAKQAADEANKLAKIAKLKTSIMTLKSEKGSHVNTIGQRTFTLYSENRRIDGDTLYEKMKDEIAQIERIEKRIREIESEIAEHQSSSQHVDVNDVTDDDDDDE